MTDDKMREAFEAWYCQDGNYEPEDLDWHRNDFYTNHDTENAWQAWQAATASKAQEIEALRADAERYKLTLEKIAGISRHKYSTDWSAVIAAMMMADEVLAVKAKP